MKPLPLPTAPILSAPTLATADAVVWGATLSILMAWWQGGCRPLPDSDAGLAVLARCHSRRWYNVREQVKLALSEIMPPLAAMYARQSEVAQVRSAMAYAAGVASAKARKHRVERSAPAFATTDILSAMIVRAIPERVSKSSVVRTHRDSSANSSKTGSFADV
jgi:uncharacterized protein YdaU (DUF1376 family)